MGDPKTKVDPAQWGIKQLISLDKPGLSRTQGTIHRGSNSGFQALDLAVSQLNAGRVILLGYDMMMAGDKRHFFGDHPQPLNMASDYTKFMHAFQTVKPEDYGIEIWNCTRRTAMACFPIYSLDDL